MKIIKIFVIIIIENEKEMFLLIITDENVGIKGCCQMVRHRVLIPAFVGSNPASPAQV